MSNAQTIYTQLRAAGLTEAAALGMLGNWQCESGLEANRVQGDYSPYRTLSKEYTAKVESGAISRQIFSSDQKGYGLAQWTYVNYPANTKGRKFNLYDFWKKSGKPLDSVEMQVQFAIHELQTDYAHVGKKLKTESDLYTATKIICVEYEQPRINNIDERFQAAKDLKAQIQLDAPTGTVDAPTGTVDVPTGWEKIPATEYWPPRTICEGMDGKDVVLLRSLLYARGWVDYVDDDYFDKGLATVVKHFQEAYGLDVDGIVGPQTWGELLNRG